MFDIIFVVGTIALFICFLVLILMLKRDINELEKELTHQDAHLRLFLRTLSDSIGDDFNKERQKFRDEFFAELNHHIVLLNKEIEKIVKTKKEVKNVRDKKGRFTKKVS